MRCLLQPVTFAIIGFLATGCTATKTTNTQPKFFNVLPTKSSEIATELNINKKYILLNRMQQADFLTKLVNDKKLVDELAAPFTFNEQKKQCIYNSINKDELNDKYITAIEEIMSIHPNDIDVFIDELDFLIPITSKYFKEFAVGNFDMSNIVNEPTFNLLTSEQKNRLQATINNEKFAPLLFAIGLPGTFDGITMRPNQLKFARVRQLITDAANKCGIESIASKLN